MQKVKTYVVYILDSNLAYEDERMEDLQVELDKRIGEKKTALTINFTPVRESSKHVVGIWALAKTESENEVIIDQLENILKEKGVCYIKNETHTILDEEVWYKELR